MSKVSNQRPAERRRWGEYDKESSEQLCNGCCVNPEVAIVHLLERTSHFQRWVETKFEQLRSCNSLPSNAGLLGKGFLYLIDRRKTSQCRVICLLDLTRKMSGKCHSLWLLCDIPR
jgi:hypothetical protein